MKKCFTSLNDFDKLVPECLASLNTAVPQPLYCLNIKIKYSQTMEGTQPYKLDKGKNKNLPAHKKNNLFLVRFASKTFWLKINTISNVS